MLVISQRTAAIFRFVSPPPFREFSRRKCFIPEPPKKPWSSYVLFGNDKRAEIVQQFPALSMAEVSVKLAALWKSLPSEEKRRYGDKFVRKCKEYKTLEEEWWNGLSEKQQRSYWILKDLKKLKLARKKLKRELKDLGKPSKPKTGMFRFFRECAENEEIKSLDVGKNHMERWKRLTEEEKSKYEASSRDDFRKFENDIRAWELKMMREGRGDLLRKWDIWSRELKDLKKKLNLVEDGSASSDSSDDET